MGIDIKDCIVLHHSASDHENNAVLNYLNAKWDIGLDEQDTPLIYHKELHCFFIKRNWN